MEPSGRSLWSAKEKESGHSFMLSFSTDLNTKKTLIWKLMLYLNGKFKPRLHVVSTFECSSLIKVGEHFFRG